MSFNGAKEVAVFQDLEGEAIGDIDVGFPDAACPLDLVNGQRRMSDIREEKAELLVNFVLDVAGQFLV